MSSIVRFLALHMLLIVSSMHGFVDNIVCQDQNNPVYFSQVYEYPEYKDAFFAYAQKHICDETLFMYGLGALVENYPNDFEPLIDTIVQHIRTSSITIPQLEKIYKALNGYLPGAEIEKIMQACEQKWPQSDSHLTIENVLNADHQIPTFLSYASLQPLYGTQTEHQASKYLANIIALLTQYKIKDENPIVKKMLMAAFIKEVQEFKKGNYVFWHGRKYDWDYCAYLYKKIYNLTHSTQDQVGDDYTFLRFDNSISCWGSENIDGLYMNAYLFGNIDCWGHSTIQLILSNNDWSYNLFEKFTSEYILTQFDCAQYYTKYQKEFEKLKQLHSQACQSIGNLLMICIDKKHIDQVYSAADCTEYKVPITLSDGTQTTEVKKIIDDLRKGTLTDFDHLQCVLPLTNDYALDPKNGPRIYSFKATDPIKQKEFDDFGEQLFAKIAADLQNEKLVFDYK